MGTRRSSATSSSPPALRCEQEVPGHRRDPPLRRREGADRRPLRPASSPSRASSRSPMTPPTRAKVAASRASWKCPGATPRRHQLRDRLPGTAALRRRRAGRLARHLRGRRLCDVQRPPESARPSGSCMVSMFNLGEARREAMGTLTYEERVERLKQAAEARSREARGEPVTPRAGRAGIAGPVHRQDTRLYRQGYEYYVTARAKHPNSPNRYMLSSLPLQMAFFPYDQVETISPRPMLMIVGEHADTKFWSDEVLAKAKEPKGTLRRERRDAHGYVRQAAVRWSGADQAERLLQPASRLGLIRRLPAQAFRQGMGIKIPIPAPHPRLRALTK